MLIDRHETIVREVGHALRGLARNPGFTLIVLITLSLGIGATTAIFTMLDRVVIRPLPYRDANQLVWLDFATPGVGHDSKWGLSVAEFYYFQKNARTIENIGVYERGPVTITGLQPPSAFRPPTSARVCSACSGCAHRSAVCSLRRTISPTVTR